ncbi:SDR family NAD(P)-dependent oxidoreductase [Zeaxanthinibacter sp. PT1]|uniref:SDR family NAD(P)-dependent oxidoreductase n=1 Tax=Zeaxanthinibacter TaxID=561554 RepID=UPI0023496AB5|nr:SDR family oxidoreductase [Zeaxanthinibacter sp. PT1]MDC6352676.1 SDR family NAD(P)-dependent oxidoreductase [Zeaxanthinibacter sp. PT1]
MANVIVTGSSRGIGFQLAKQLAENGHNVLALSRNDDPIKQLNNSRITALSLDICKPDELEGLRASLKGEWSVVDILIHNAGYLVNKPFMQTSMDDFRQVYDVNVFGLAALTQVVLPYMNSGGHVLTISSMGGIQGSSKFPGLAAYSSSKGAVITLTELLAEEFKDNGPSFNALALGAVQTEMLETAFPGYQAPTTAEEMANYIADFALNGQKFYNGKVLQVSNSTP